jgi:hypothetical protein
VLQVIGPVGQTIRARASCPDVQLWGMTPDQVAVYLWPQVQNFVLASINDLTNKTPAPLENPDISVPVVFA